LDVLSLDCILVGVEGVLELVEALVLIGYQVLHKECIKEVQKILAEGSHGLVDDVYLRIQKDITLTILS
jgi:hypothetical protein